ncbi:MAG: efflux RND transporter permease subunit, partial [Rikenellaceae bacterium]
IKTEYFPPVDNGRITGTVRLDQNLSVEYTSRIARQIDSIIYTAYPEVELVSASAGANSSSDAFAAMQTTGSYIINYNMRLPASTERQRSIYEISDLLRRELDAIPEVRDYTVMPGGSRGGTSGASLIDIKIFGYDIERTNSAAHDLMAQVREINGIRDVQLSRDDLRPEYNVNFDREKLSYYGLNYNTVAQAVSNRLDGLIASRYREDGDEYDIVVRYGEEYRASVDNIEAITIFTPQNSKIQLRDIATVEQVFGAPSIERENRQRVIRIEGSLGAGVPLSEVINDINALLTSYQSPDGVSIEVGGTIEDQQESFSDMTLLFLLIVILVYIVMATQFESLLFPFIIMFTIPLAFTGVILALYITNVPMSLIALIGAIMLVGIVTKNGIVMVDYINLLVERGESIHNSVFYGAKSRLRPVLMTSFTTILGMLPMALGAGAGSETWQPMGIAVIGGLTLSTLLTLYVVPIFYSVMVGIKSKSKAYKKDNK